MRIKVAAVVVFVAALVGGWFYFQSRVIRVWLYTDYAFRLKHADWPKLVESRILEVNRIYQQSGTGVRWKLLDGSQVDPTSTIPTMDSRRANMVFHQDRKTDVYVILTGVQEGKRTGSVNPFTNVAMVVDLPDKSESVNGRLLAYELTHLFGSPHESAWQEALMADKPESNKFSERTADLVKRMRNYPFASGIDGLAQGSWEKKALSALAADDPGPRNKPQSHAHTVIAMALLNERKKDDALAHFKAAVQEDPESVSARLNLAEAYTRNAQDNMALEQAREVVRLAPNDALAHRALGALLGRTRQPDQAIGELRLAGRLEPNNVDTQVLLGLQLASTFGHLDDAISTLQAATRLDPNSTAAAQALEKAQALKASVAEELVRQRGLLQQNPNDADAHYRMAKVEARAGDMEGAIRDFQKAADLRPNNGTPHAELAELYWIKGDVGGAWNEVRKARSLGTEPAPALLAKLPPQK